MAENIASGLTDQFVPLGTAYANSSAIAWMNAISHIVIALACCALPFVLVYIAKRRRDLPLDWLVIAFGACVFIGGLMHLLAAWNVWHTAHWAEAIARVLTAISVIPAAILLWRYLPELLSLPSQRQLQVANESLARANRELEAFTASVSHDLRSPLTTIAGQAGMLGLALGSNATEEQKRRLQRIESSVKQMSDLIDALLVLSRISRHTLRRETVDLSELAEHVIADLRQKHPDRHVEVTIQPNMVVHGDRRLISDLITNLISNAWKFTSKLDHAHIEIGETIEGEMSKVHVRDNGAGFDMKYAAKLFKPFQRLHAPTEFEGSGIGLATVARIVDRHGGRIWAEAKEAEGATFYFTLPRAPITAEILAGPRPSAASQS
jgi:signal transduction histidine kinase